jgi:hypothetical protein
MMLGAAQSPFFAGETLKNGTISGARLEFTDEGVTIEGRVPGSDFLTAKYRLDYPFTEAAFGLRLQALEQECEDLREWSLGMGDDPPVEDYGFKRV